MSTDFASIAEWREHVRVPSSVGPAVAVSAVVDAILTEPTDGATIMASGLPYGGSGIVVALDRHGIVINQRVVDALADLNLTPRDLVEQWVTSRAPVVTNGQTLRRRAYGAWRHGEEIHLDIVEIFPDDEEAEAVKIGQSRNQISIWHAGRGEEIPTGGTGDDPWPNHGASPELGGAHV